MEKKVQIGTQCGIDKHNNRQNLNKMTINV